jgi:hypothetical protein
LLSNDSTCCTTHYLKAAVTSNLTQQVLTVCTAVRDSLGTHNAKVGGSAHARAEVGLAFTS